MGNHQYAVRCPDRSFKEKAEWYFMRFLGLRSLSFKAFVNKRFSKGVRVERFVNWPTPQN